MLNSALMLSRKCHEAFATPKPLHLALGLQAAFPWLRKVEIFGCFQWDTPSPTARGFSLDIYLSFYHACKISRFSHLHLGSTSKVVMGVSDPSQAQVGWIVIPVHVPQAWPHSNDTWKTLPLFSSQKFTFKFIFLEA